VSDLNQVDYSSSHNKKNREQTVNHTWVDKNKEEKVFYGNIIFMYYR